MPAVVCGEAWWTGSQEVDAKLLTGATGTFKVSVDKETIKKAKSRLKERAGYWFEEAWSLLTDAERDRVRPRFRALHVNPAAGPDKKGPIEGWDHWDIASLADRSGAYTRSGKHSLHGPANAKGQVNMKLKVDFRMIPGKKYIFSGWFLTEGNVRGSLGMAMNDAGGKLFQIGLPIHPDRPYWSRQQLTFEGPKGIGDTNFKLEVGGKSGQVWIDDIRLRCEGREPLSNGSFER